jgi:hypothetical protein
LGSDSRVRNLIRSVDSNVRLTIVGLIGGAAAGSLYLLQSAAHMTVQGSRDLLVIGACLALVGACLGWLAGAMVRHALYGAHPTANSVAAKPQHRSQ